MNIQEIITERLILYPANYEIVESLLNGDMKKIEELGFRVHDKWPREDTMDILPLIKDKLEKSGEIKGFDMWLIIRKEDRLVIGDAGFKGGPDRDGNVEIGYGLVRDEQRKGYGTEAVDALIKWAFNQSEVKVINAECLIDNVGSIRILEKISMDEVKRDDIMIYWELKK